MTTNKLDVVLVGRRERLSDADINRLAAYIPPSRIGVKGAELVARRAKDSRHAKAAQHCQAALFWIRHTLPEHSETRAALVDKICELQAAWDSAIEGAGA